MSIKMEGKKRNIVNLIKYFLDRPKIKALPSKAIIITAYLS